MQPQMSITVMSRNERKSLLIVAAALLAQYIAINFVDYPGMAAYYVPPAMWIAIFMYTYPKLRTGPLHGPRLLLLVLALSAARVSIEALMGVYTGFASNITSMSWASMLLTMYFVGVRVVAYESARALFASRLGRLSAAWIIVISALFTALLLQPAEITSLQSTIAYIKFMDTRLAPLFALNLFLTFLALWGGFAYSALYQLLYLAYTTIMPILPDLHWVLRTYVGVLVPLLGVTIIYMLRTVRLYAREEPASLKPLAWLIPAAVVLLLVSGVVGYRPFTVISGSMEPGIQIGDLVIVDMGNKDVKRGDVVAYAFKGRVVVHRVVEAQEGIYVTKGDALDEPDSWIVSKEMILGKVVYTVPKLGLISIYFWRLLGYAEYIAVATLALIPAYLGISRYRSKRW